MRLIRPLFYVTLLLFVGSIDSKLETVVKLLLIQTEIMTTAAVPPAAPSESSRLAKRGVTSLVHDTSQIQVGCGSVREEG
jgi:hypothetical protein